MNNRERIKSYCSVSLLAAAPVLFGAATPESGLTRIDVTAAVREAGDLRTVTANVTPRSDTYALEKAFDGKAAAQTDGLFSDYDNAGQTPVKDAYAAGGVTLEYAIDASFAADKDIVIDGYSILSVASVAHALNRLPGTWQFQAYDDATSAWVTLDARTAYAGWTENLTYDGTKQAGSRFRFVNSKSYRKYRFLIMAPYWKTAGVWTDEEAATNNKGALQISEIQLFGYVADGIDGTVNTGLLDLTAFVREGGDEFRTVESNLKANSDDLKLENLFDGIGSNRFFSNYADSVKPAYENGGAWVEYIFDEAFAPNADIVATGYSISVSTNSSFAHALKRMPCDWAFQGYDEAENAWKTLDAYHDFTCWETVDVSGTPSLGFRFDFPNAAAYRRYRLLISRQYWGRAGIDPVSSNLGALQLSEIQIFGYLGTNIAGTVEQATTAHPLKLTAWANVADFDGQRLSPPFAPVVSNSTCSAVAAGTVQSLFNGLRHDRFLCTPSGFPFDVYYEIPATMFLADKDMVLTNYVLEVETGFGNYAARVPKAWRLEAFADGRWVALDRRSEATWQEEPFSHGENSYTAYRAVCEIASEKRFTATRYRLRIKSLAGATDFQLSELTLNGVWGTGIANPPPARKGLLMVIR